MKKAIGVFLLVLVSTTIQAQAIRASVISIININADNPDGASVNIRYNDSVAIQWPTDNAFLQGLEFELKIPKAFQGYESQLAWSIYSKLKPFPASDKFDYNAELIATQALPSRVSLNLILPIAERHTIKSGAFASVIPFIADKEKFPLLFKLTPIGKGLSQAMEKAELKLTVRPVLKDEGAIRIAISYPDASDKPNHTIYIDDKKIDDPASTIYIKKGTHTLRVTAEGYKEEVVTFAAEAGKTNQININLVPNIPLLIFQAPAGTYITVDGQVLNQNDFSGINVEPGEHTLFIRIGDYTMTRKIIAQRGRVYRIVLSVELGITTSP